MSRTIRKGHTFGNDNLHPAADAFIDAELFVCFPVHGHSVLFPLRVPYASIHSAKYEDVFSATYWWHRIASVL